MTTSRLKPADRRRQIIAVSLGLAEIGNYTQLTRNQITDAIGVAGAVLHQQFGTMAKLRRAIMRAAVTEERLLVIGQGLVANDPQAMKASPELRERALKYLIDKNVS